MRIISTSITDEQYEQLKDAADTLCDGNISEITRRFMLATLDDYRSLRRLGLFRLINLWRHLVTWHHRRSIYYQGRSPNR